MRVYVWGTGVILGRVLDYRIKLDEVIAFIDNNSEKNEYMGVKVIRPNEIGIEYDAIVVANSYAKEIYEQCKTIDNIDLNKLIFLYNNYELSDLNSNYEFIASVFDPEYAELIRSKYHLIRSVARDEVMPALFDEFKTDKMYKEDFVRIKDLELAICEIKRKNVLGAIAEVGVYQGNFAKYMNAAFPDRKCYLFDTFEGFREDEANKEKEAGNVNDSFIDGIKNTSVELAMSKMKYKENVVVIKGLFPESLRGG